MRVGGAQRLSRCWEESKSTQWCPGSMGCRGQSREERLFDVGQCDNDCTWARVYFSYKGRCPQRTQHPETLILILSVSVLWRLTKSEHYESAQLQNQDSAFSGLQGLFHLSSSPVEESTVFFIDKRMTYQLIKKEERKQSPYNFHHASIFCILNTLHFFYCFLTWVSFIDLLYTHSCCFSIFLICRNSPYLHDGRIV